MGVLRECPEQAVAVCALHVFRSEAGGPAVAVQCRPVAVLLKLALQYELCSGAAQ